MGLLLWGPVGTGKSFIAGCIANALLDQGVPVMMTNFARLLNKLTDMCVGDRNAYIDSFNSFPLLIIDDLGVERNSEFAREQVFSVIDSLPQPAAYDRHHQFDTGADAESGRSCQGENLRPRTGAMHPDPD